MIFVIVLVAFLFIIILKVRSIHLKIDFKSFFRRGFKKVDSPHGLICFTRCSTVHGKTYSSVSLLKKLVNNNNYTIITNVKSLKGFKNIIYFSDIADVINFINNNYEQGKYIIFFDEIFSVMERNIQRHKSNDNIKTFISQLRKREMFLITTAQIWSKIDIELRKMCRFQVSCKMIKMPFSKRAVVINNINNGYEIKWDSMENDFIAPRIQTNVSKGLYAVINSYDSWEII